MYLEHFGLQEAPFSLAPDPRYIYLSGQHREALAHLLYGVRSEGGFVQITGEVGTGKTTVCRCFLEQLPRGTRAAVILNPSLTAEELLEAVCDEFEIPRPVGPTSLKGSLDLLNRFLLDAHAAGERAVLIIDEAQNLAPAVLEQVRLLTNLETSRHKLLQVILMGQPELRETLERNDLRQLAQRITARFHLRPLPREETAAYVRHRLSVAGCYEVLFPEPVIGRLQRLSRGVPRLINILCDRALLGAYAQGKHRVDRATLERAASEVAGKAGWRSSGWKLLAAAVTGSFLVAAVWLAANVRRTVESVAQPPAAAAPTIPPPQGAGPSRVQATAVDETVAVAAEAHTAPSPPLPAIQEKSPSAPSVSAGEAAPVEPTELREAPASGTTVQPPPESTPSEVTNRVSASKPTMPLAEAPTLAAIPPSITRTQPKEVPGRPPAAGPAAAPVTAAHLSDTGVSISPPSPAPEETGAKAAADVPSPTVPDAFQALLARPEAQREEEAWVQLYRLWGIRAKAREKGCTLALAHGLDCLRGVGGIEQLRALDRPAIVRLQDGGGAQRWLVIVRLVDEQALVSAGGTQATVSVAALPGYGVREFMLFWRPPAQTRTISPGDRGAGVAWLERRLAAEDRSGGIGWLERRLEAALEAASSSEPTHIFDEVLAERVREFQRSRGLTVDGVAGPAVLLALDTDPEPKTPTLGATGR